MKRGERVLGREVVWAVLLLPGSSIRDTRYSYIQWVYVQFSRLKMAIFEPTFSRCMCNYFLVPPGNNPDLSTTIFTTCYVVATAHLHYTPRSLTPLPPSIQATTYYARALAVIASNPRPIAKSRPAAAPGGPMRQAAAHAIGAPCPPLGGRCIISLIWAPQSRGKARKKNKN